MVKLFSAGPESKYAVEELDKATQYYTNNPNAKYSDLVGPENKPLRVKIRKALEYRGGKFVVPGSLPQDSDKARTSKKLKDFLKKNANAYVPGSIREEIEFKAHGAEYLDKQGKMQIGGTSDFALQGSGEDELITKAAKEQSEAIVGSIQNTNKRVGQEITNFKNDQENKQAFITNQVNEIVSKNTEFEQYIKQQIKQIKNLSKDEKIVEKERLTNEINEHNTWLNAQNKDVNNKQKAITKEAKDFDKYLSNEANKIDALVKDLGHRNRTLQSATQSYYTMQSKQGSFLGATWDSLLTGIENLAEGSLDLVIDATTYSQALNLEALESIGLVNEGDYMALADQKSKLAKENIYPHIRGGLVRNVGAGVNKEFLEVEKSTFWGGAWYGLMESIPAMAATTLLPAGAISTYGGAFLFGTQTVAHLNKEMDENPAFDNWTEGEKWAVKGPIAAAVGVLENYGFRNIMQGESFRKNS